MLKVSLKFVASVLELPVVVELTPHTKRNYSWGSAKSKWLLGTFPAGGELKHFRCEKAAIYSLFDFF